MQGMETHSRTRRDAHKVPGPHQVIERGPWCTGIVYLSIVLMGAVRKRTVAVVLTSFAPFFAGFDRSRSFLEEKPLCFLAVRSRHDGQ